MSKFINTDQKITIDSLVDGLKEKFDNPYYLFTDKKATTVEYYNQSTTKSTVDEATGNVMAFLGDQSPIKYNLIHDAFIYGLSKVEISQQIGEFGYEADNIEGECIVLPNTFTPIPGDYFRIQYVQQDILFKITEVSIDTLDTGANLYRCRYKLDRYNDDRIEDQVDKEFNMVVSNIGTNYSAVITSTSYDLIKQLDNILSRFKTYFVDLFYSSKVQNLIFNYNNTHFYDAYMIEFIIRNKILDGTDEFIYVAHDVSLPSTFVLDYDRSYFRSLELHDKTKLSTRLQSYGVAVTDVNSLMSIRSEDYFSIDYTLNGNVYNTVIDNFPLDLNTHITSNTKYTDEDTTNPVWNIVIEYFNSTDIPKSIVEDLTNLDIEANKDYFYAIPIIIFIVEHYIQDLLKEPKQL